MHQSYRRLSAANPKLRLSAANFVDQGKKIGGFFETPLIRLTDDIESLGLKNDEEREEFLKLVHIRKPYETKLTFTVNLTPYLKTFLKTFSR